MKKVKINDKNIKIKLICKLKSKLFKLQSTMTKLNLVMLIWQNKKKIISSEKN